MKTHLSTRTPEASAPVPCSAFWVLFQHMSQNHGMTLLDSELSDICDAVDEMRAAWEVAKLKSRCHKCWGDGQVEIQSGPYYRTCDACGGSGQNDSSSPTGSASESPRTGEAPLLAVDWREL